MDIFGGVQAAFSQIPDWISFLILPTLSLGYAGVEGLRGEPSAKRYFGFQLVLFACGVALLAGKGTARICLFGGAFVLFSAALYPLPRALRFLTRRRGKKEYRAEQISPARPPEYPPMVCKFEEEVAASERFICVDHALSLLKKLSDAALSPTDRLETEALAQSVTSMRARPLTDGECGRLNDYLAATLKLAAKYRI